MLYFACNKPTNDDHITKKKNLKEDNDETHKEIETTRVRRNSALTLLQFSNVYPFKWSKNLYICFYCQKNINFVDIEQLREHIADVHKTLDAAHIKKCLGKLKRYELVKVNVADLTCKLCNDVASSIGELKVHLVKHDKKLDIDEDGILPFRITKDEFNCALCNEKYDEYKTLSKHMNAHFKNYICDQCGVGFVSPERLRNHVFTHASRSYPCDSCDKVFRHATVRKEHYAIVHMNAKKNRCPHCFETFKNFYQKKKHMNSAHGVKVKEFQCDLCPKSFMQSGYLHAHRRIVHLKLKRYSCDICDVKFFYKYKLENHMICHGGEKKYKCEVCEKAFARKYLLTGHMRIHTTDNSG